MWREIKIEVVERTPLGVYFRITHVSKKLIDLLHTRNLRINGWSIRSDYVPELSGKTLFVWGTVEEKNSRILMSCPDLFESLMEALRALKDYETIEDEFFKRHQLSLT